ncbi:Tetratricopeptide repeat protein [Echinococcus granulosus]|uniref:Tetratricopeptide repeat protein n=1 Tax=Echinococcus granulosus TaxID=6210 RepID=W6U7Q7_ECHGR|nr:Tetratricopeptide repeat protein [Echinococcus granulosus]EUB54407.1 Tetratricopeptide repeat protein [Echinococcus granulosus]
MDPTFSVTELSEVELQELRKTDAWLPSEATRRCLLEGGSGGLASTAPRLLAPPSPIDTADPIHRQLVNRYRSDVRANAIRPVITADMVSQDCDGLVQLIKGRWYHAALDLTGRLLTICGFASDTGAKLTPFSSQLWLVRFVLLKQTRQFDLLERELAAFDRLDNPDVYFEHAPDLYPRRKVLSASIGSMIPFSLRLLHAELPHHLNRSGEALDRLYFLAAVVARVISNLENGYTEDGSESYPNEAYKISSLVIWRRRESKILAICLSIYLANQDYPSAIETVYQMIDKLEPLGEHRFLYGTLGRIYLGMGDVDSAEEMFKEALKDASPDLTTTRIQWLMYSAMLQIGSGHFDEAKRLFREVLELDPSNVAAANNQAVCSHYIGQMDESLRILEVLTTPAQYQQQQQLKIAKGETASQSLLEGPALHEAIVSNLSNLLDAESDHATTRKMSLLERVATLPGERVAPTAFKLKLA